MASASTIPSKFFTKVVVPDNRQPLQSNAALLVKGIYESR